MSEANPVVEDVTSVPNVDAKEQEYKAFCEFHEP